MACDAHRSLGLSIFGIVLKFAFFRRIDSSIRRIRKAFCLTVASPLPRIAIFPAPLESSFA